MARHGADHVPAWPAGVGLGRVLARRFTAEGETVILLGRTLAKLEAVVREIGGKAMAFHCDVSSATDVRACFAVISERVPAIDVLINNAAVYEPFTVQDATDEQIQSIINTNFTGAIYCTRAAIPLMRCGSHIINVSTEGVELPFPLMTVYQASKAGLERFTTGLYRELDPQGIRVSYLRAGAMTEEGTSWNVPAETAARFLKEAAAAGLNTRKRGGSQFESATYMFRVLIDMPDDLHALGIGLFARRP